MKDDLYLIVKIDLFRVESGSCPRTDALSGSGQACGDVKSAAWGLRFCGIVGGGGRRGRAVLDRAVQGREGRVDGIDAKPDRRGEQDDEEGDLAGGPGFGLGHRGRFP